MINKKSSYIPSREAFFKRPHLSRRNFFEIAGSGLIASYLPLSAERARHGRYRRRVQ